jgi:hypothetical protein
MNKLLVVAVLGCLGLSACEQKLSGDSPDDPGPPANEAKPVYAPTPWQEPDFRQRDAGRRAMNGNP